MTDWLRIVTADDVGTSSFEGLGASTEHAIRTARTLVGVPTAEGGFQIELHAGGADIEISIEPDGRVSGASFDWNTRKLFGKDTEKLARWMIYHGFATGHGDTTEDLLHELTWQLNEIRSKKR